MPTQQLNARAYPPRTKLLQFMRLAASRQRLCILWRWRQYNMNLRDKYNHAIQTAKGFRMQGAAEERGGKLYFKGVVRNQDEVNKIWDAIKTVPDWRNDVVAEVTIDPNAKAAAATYTVKSGDTLSKI